MSVPTKEELDMFWANATDEQKRDYMYKCVNENTKNRNMDKTKKFAEKIIKKENNKTIKYAKFLQSDSVNGIIYAPTQVGKSAATREFIETCFEYNTPVIVSTDNKTDQQEQLYSRIEANLIGANVNLLKVSDKKFETNIENLIKNKNKRFVIFCLDNASQITKVIRILTSIYMRFDEVKELKRIAIIHDEADTIAKDQNTENQNSEQPESHKKWLELKDLINKKMGSIDLKRMFVTATPENCVMLYKVESPDVMRLEVPSSYLGYKSIIHTKMEDDLTIKKLLKKEVERIRDWETHEAILYCIDRKISDGQDVVLENLSKYAKCVVNTYNGNGITAYMRTNGLCKKFEQALEDEEIDYKEKNKFYTMKKMSIRRFYTIIKSIGEQCVITIGKDLICRGISYVGENEKHPITATTMFYKPGTSMHAVGICQTIGRITGCAMPTLPRRLYAPQDVYETYIAYNKNQELYMNSLKKASEETLTNEVIDELDFYQYKRSIDRSKLKLKMKMTKKYESESEDDSEASDSEDRMKELINMWWGKKSIIGKILQFVYENEDGVLEDDLKTYISSISNSSRTWYTDLHTTQKEYINVFIRNNRITNLKQEAREYIDEM